MNHRFGFSSQKEFEGYCKCINRVRIGDDVGLWISFGGAAISNISHDCQLINMKVIGIAATTGSHHIHKQLAIGSPTQQNLCLWRGAADSFPELEMMEGWLELFPYVRYISSPYDGRLGSITRAR